MNKAVQRITEQIISRSQASRERYLEQIDAQIATGRIRSHLTCGNLAHTVAASDEVQKQVILNYAAANVGIVTAYNDMLSAHQPYKDYPEQIKAFLAELGHSAQVAGGVPAMCDGVTQGQPGMDLSLFSRDVIAQATAVSLSHNTFDAALLLGICDKIAPGQLIGALAFGHMPAAFVPSGPMSSGISNHEKVAVRQKYAAGEVGKDALQKMECQAYHSSGTCTFYGTANTNQLVFEAMGLMLPGSAFVAPHSELRQALTREVAQLVASQIQGAPDFRPLARVLDEKALVNGLVALLASGGSTNHTMHMIAIARAAGIIVTWDDLDKLSEVVPLLANIYPNAPADINGFQQAGGLPVLMKRLSERGLLNMDATPVSGTMENYLTEPELDENGRLRFVSVDDTRDADVIASAGACFSEHGGLRLLDGNLGRGVMKVSAVAPEHHIIEAPVRVFTSQHDVPIAYERGELNQDVIVVVHHCGPAARGMPELHKLMPVLGNVMKAGYKVALVTDGRLSGASGKVPSVIHVTPEAYRGGPLGLLRDGDIVRIDAVSGEMQVLSPVEGRTAEKVDLTEEHYGSGRQLFSLFRNQVSGAERGASIFNYDENY